MHRLFAAFFWLLISSVACAAEPSYIILNPSQGTALFKQCSRTAPENISSFWRPELSQIQEIETGLPVFLRSHPNGKLVRPLPEFKRQYIGYIQNGKKYIYGNFYLSGMHGVEFSSKPVVICDGGRSFWGVVYSLEGKAFQELAFNGAI